MVAVQKMKDYREIPIMLPKVGDKVPVEMFHVSKMNVRFGEPFGEDEEDKNLIANLKVGKIVQPFKARPEADGYGVVLGRRRFLGKKEVGAKFLVVGDDCLIEEMTDQESREASLIEHLFHKELNPITRAKKLNEAIMERGESLRATARRWGIPASTLSEYLSVLKLSPKMQDALTKDLLSYSDGVMLARMKLDHALQDELAEVLETQGTKAFKKLLRKRVSTKRASAKKPAKGDVISGKVYWKQLTRSLRDFANYWSDYSTLEEWESDEAWHLRLEVTMPKNLNETYESNGLETLGADEAPQICASCGGDVLAGDPFAEKDGFYYCGKCADEGID